MHEFIRERDTQREPEIEKRQRETERETERDSETQRETESTLRSMKECREANRYTLYRRERNNMYYSGTVKCMEGWTTVWIHRKNYKIRPYPYTPYI